VGTPVVATKQVTQEPLVIVIVIVPLYLLFAMDAAAATLRNELAQQFDSNHSSPSSWKNARPSRHITPFLNQRRSSKR
jgi:hypothetical protein